MQKKTYISKPNSLASLLPLKKVLPTVTVLGIAFGGLLLGSESALADEIAKYICPPTGYPDNNPLTPNKCTAIGAKTGTGAGWIEDQSTGSNTIYTCQLTGLDGDSCPIGHYVLTATRYKNVGTGHCDNKIYGPMDRTTYEQWGRSTCKSWTTGLTSSHMTTYPRGQ